jgi:hypothetical protein
MYTTLYFSFTESHLVRRPLTGLLYQPQVLDEYEAFGGARVGRGILSKLRRPDPVPLCPQQIPLDQTWGRIWAFAVEPD